jgi:plasmid stability protein
MKATFDLDDGLYRAIRVEAARADRPVRSIVEEALEAWLTHAEEVEDRDSAAAALAEYRKDGGASAEEWFGRLAAETKAGYGSDPTDGR